MLYLITNRHLVRCKGFEWVINEALRGGVDKVILREKDLTFKELLPIATKVKKIAKSYNKQLIVNNCLKTAESVNADYFHIGYEGYLKRNFNLQHKKFGLSIHNVDEAIMAERIGASYILASHIYNTQCKAGLEPKGSKLISDIKGVTNIPVIALGGINQNNVQEVLSAGANGVAVMSLIMGSTNPYLTTKLLKQKIKQFKDSYAKA